MKETIKETNKRLESYIDFNNKVLMMSFIIGALIWIIAVLYSYKHQL